LVGVGPTSTPSLALHTVVSLQTSGIRSELVRELVHHFTAASGYIGGCTQRQREDAHYERGRKDGLGQALELVDAWLRAENEDPGPRRTADEIVADCQ
jgi:hypothetical protein